jgi:hypothetical protein
MVWPRQAPSGGSGGSWEVAGAVGWLGKAGRGAEGVTREMAVHEGGLYSHSRARHGCGLGGGQGRAGGGGVRAGGGGGGGAGGAGGGGACERALGAFPSACPRRTRGGLLLPVFKDLFGRLSV